jgi:hypothetical protein
VIRMFYNDHEPAHFHAIPFEKIRQFSLRCASKVEPWYGRMVRTYALTF